MATVAHELRSPLTGVKGFVQAMLNRWDKLTDEQKKLMLTTVHADADRLSRLIAELLDVARIDTGRLSLHPRPCDADRLVGTGRRSVQAGTARTIDVRRRGGPVPEIGADPDKFTQVVTNLVENAVRHGEGAVTVTLAALTDDTERRGIRLVVEDEGDGIPEEMRRRVFTKFWTSGVRGGSGLGMYLVNGLTRAHGGSIVLGDAESGGARVVVEWPSRRESRLISTQPPRVVRAIRLPALLVSSHGPNEPLLVVEDEPRHQRRGRRPTARPRGTPWSRRSTGRRRSTRRRLQPGRWSCST